MVKTRRSNGENGEAEDRIGEPHEEGSASNDKHASDWSQRELRSASGFSVTRKHWPTKYSRRLRAIKMPRIMFQESDTEPEKYSRRRPVRVFFAGDTPTEDRTRRRRVDRKNYVEDTSEDKPIQQNVRRSGRKRKLLHHNFNESWITNELKVRGYPDLYGFRGSSSSDEFSSADERNRDKNSNRSGEAHPGEDGSQVSRQRRTSARCSGRFSATKKQDHNSDTDSDGENLHKTVIENKKGTDKSEKNDDDDKMHTEGDEDMKQGDVGPQDSESNQGPLKPTRSRRGRPPVMKKQHESGTETESSDSGSDIMLPPRQPRRSNRTRKPQPTFVVAERTPAKTYTIRKKPYSLRERKSPKILRRKTIRSQSPSSSSSSSSSDTEDLNVSVKNKTKGRQKSKASGDNQTKSEQRALREIQPVEVDMNVRFASVGGLDEHISCLREMVLFPLMYPALFRKFGTRPAKGVLFHGPPGTGKTLLARALAAECSRLGGRRVAFFMRKGADCLKKWVGESERHLKLLFQQANKMKPSIIFFDEIDALAPVRSVRQEQVHTSVVGTLLAEMDGLCDRGEVVVVGATNRLDAVDPALRRAGRFDRELYFPHPPRAARRDILDIYTRGWRPTPPADTLDRIAALTNGYGGSDIKALCSEAVLKALKRVYPQVYESEYALLIDAEKVEVSEQDMVEAMRTLVAAGARTCPPPARPLPAHAQPLLGAQLTAAHNVLSTVFSSNRDNRHRVQPSSSSSVLLVCGECSDTLVAPALLAALEHCAVRELSMATLHSALAFSHEQALISIFSECRRADRGCVLFVREAGALWQYLGEGGARLLRQLWRARAAGERTLLLATCRQPYRDLPQQLKDLFPQYKECIYEVREPTVAETIDFLKPVMVMAPLAPPAVVKAEHHPPLPRAPPPPPPKESEQDRAKRKRAEDYKLRELRIFLRDICRKLASNRRFYKFTKPVDLEEVTDYLDIIKQPMDLETMMTKVDMHRYNCAKEFLEDIDLICANALEYNPDRTSSDKQIRHEACSLRDHAHALIEVEMDSDFETECREIARRRRTAAAAPDDLPSFIFTASHLAEGLVSREEAGVGAPADGQPQLNGERHDGSGSGAPKRKRRRLNAWSKGLVKRPKSQHKSAASKDDQHSMLVDEDSKENKPMTSTPLPAPLANGDARYASSNDETVSDDEAEHEHDAARTDHADGILTSHGIKLDSATKSNEKSTNHKTSPKKRNSGHESSSSELEKVIDKTELENMLYKNSKSLRTIGLEALLELHGQLQSAVDRYRDTIDRVKLPAEMHAIVDRYVRELAKK